MGQVMDTCIRTSFVDTLEQKHFEHFPQRHVLDNN